MSTNPTVKNILENEFGFYKLYIYLLICKYYWGSIIYSQLPFLHHPFISIVIQEFRDNLPY